LTSNIFYLEFGSNLMCHYPMKLWHIEDCLIRDPPIEWDSLVNWCNSHLRGRSLIAIICKLCFGASVYHLWRHRNNLLHGNTLSLEDSIVLQVKNDVRLRLIARCSTKILYRYSHLVEVWRLQQVLSGWGTGCGFCSLTFDCWGLLFSFFSFSSWGRIFRRWLADVEASRCLFGW